MRVALVTSERFPVDNWRDPDTYQVLKRLVARGTEVRVLAWDAPEPVEWAAFDVLVLQSPWSMWERLDAFRAWLAVRTAAGDRLLNPPEVVTLGMSKRYLPALADSGVPTVSTTLLTPGSPTLRDDLAAALPPPGTPRQTIVVKPVSAGGSLGAREFGPDDLDAAAMHAAALGEALAQPYIPTVDTHRELGVLTLGREISHAITKAAILRPGTTERAFHPDPRPADLSPTARTAVQRAHAAFTALLPPGVAPPLSVRLDFLTDPHNEDGLLLLEVEAVAPVRFFTLFPGHCDAYADELLTRAT